MKPFFKQATGPELDETEEIKRLNLNAPLEPIKLGKEPEAPPAGAKGKGKDAKPASNAKDKRPTPLEVTKSPSEFEDATTKKEEEAPKKEIKWKPASYRFNMATSVPPRDIDDEDLEMWQGMRQEHLAGPTKTKWALAYKNDTDQAIEASLDHETSAVSKRRTKGLFPIETATNAGNWMTDKEW